MKIVLSILTFLLLAVGIVGGVYLVKQRQILKSRADISLEPKDVQITNISESSLTISYLTAKDATGFVVYSADPSKLDNSAADVRGGSTVSTTHYVVLEKLKSATTYYFEINSGNQKFKVEKSPSTTYSAQSSPPSPSDPLFGKALAGTIIYLYLKGSALPIGSTIATEAGTFTLDLSALRIDGGSYYNPNPDDPIKLLAFNGDKRDEYVGKLGSRIDPINLALKTASEQTSIVAKVDGDLNGDGVVNAVDVGYFIKLWLAKEPKADLNKDGTINTLDYGEMLKKLAS